MKAVTFGQQGEGIILLLHGGGLSWWNYRDAAAVLARRYRVVLPILDGHPGSDAPFTTIGDNAARILAAIDEGFGGQVLAIGGVSLGAQVLVEMLSQRPDVCRYALIESALVKPMPLTHALIVPSVAMSYGLIRQRWFAKLQFAYLRLPETLFDDYYRDTSRITQDNMVAFLRANSGYTLKPAISDTKAKVFIVAGSREPKSIRDSAKLLCGAIPGSRMEIVRGLHHGELSIRHPGKYTQMLKELWEGRS